MDSEAVVNRKFAAQQPKAPSGSDITRIPWKDVWSPKVCERTVLGDAANGELELSFSASASVSEQFSFGRAHVGIIHSLSREPCASDFPNLYAAVKLARVRGMTQLLLLVKPKSKSFKFFLNLGSIRMLDEPEGEFAFLVGDVAGLAAELFHLCGDGVSKALLVEEYGAAQEEAYNVLIRFGIPATIINGTLSEKTWYVLLSQISRVLEMASSAGVRLRGSCSRSRSELINLQIQQVARLSAAAQADLRKMEEGKEAFFGNFSRTAPHSPTGPIAENIGTYSLISSVLRASLEEDEGVAYCAMVNTILGIFAHCSHEGAEALSRLCFSWGYFGDNEPTGFYRLAIKEDYDGAGWLSAISEFTSNVNCESGFQLLHAYTNIICGGFARMVEEVERATDLDSAMHSQLVFGAILKS